MGRGFWRKESKMKPYRIIKPTNQNGRLVEINTPLFKQTQFNTEDLIKVRTPIVERDGENYIYRMLLFNGKYYEIVPVKAIHNPNIEGNLQVISLLIDNNIY